MYFPYDETKTENNLKKGMLFIRYQGKKNVSKPIFTEVLDLN